ncbi:MAG: endonuclease V [Deltaproteobacteria bacterium]|nr:endonuclease V [Deltaproteobacteria bacterium]
MITQPIVILDVAYDDAAGTARSAAVLAPSFAALEPSAERVVDVAGVAPYVPGSFFLRELPCLLAVLATAPVPADAVLVIDGYVILDDVGRKGLGMHLHEATGRAVVGIAKTAFKRSSFAREVPRGSSRRPLFVTAVGVDLDDAADAVRLMAGGTRLPLLAVRADHLARGLAVVRATV